jgi:enolase-phosphatase E1
VAAGAGPGRVVVLDIEGTTSPASYVTGVMYPYAEGRFAAWLAARPEDEAMVERAAAGPALPALLAWSRADQKVTELKAVQGGIWAAGFAAGDLVAPFFPDVIPALRSWHAAGARLYVYSSGSADAQRAWFGHSVGGDLTGLISGWFDTRNAGPKREPASYERVAAGTGGPGVFLSDLAAELDAAREAGWQTVAVCRPGEPYGDQGAPGHPRVATFADLPW